MPCTIKAFPAGDRTIGRFAEFGSDFMLVDGSSPGSGEVFDWRLAEGVVDPSRLIVSGGLTADNVGDAIAHLHPFGVDVASGVEPSPGRKDPTKLARLHRRARGPPSRRHQAADGRGLGRGPDGDQDRAPYDWMDG